MTCIQYKGYLISKEMLLFSLEMIVGLKSKGMKIRKKSQYI